MKHARGAYLICSLAAAWLASAAPAGQKDAGRPKKVYVVVFDFASTPADAGQRLADTIRIRLRRHEEFEVIDRLTTREAAGNMPISAEPKKVTAVMNDQLAVHVALYGSVETLGAGLSAKIRCIDLRDPKKPGGWTQAFSDGTERARAVLSKEIVEKLRGAGEWQPPEYGDESEPKKFGQPVNANGSFEDGHAGWDHPDNVATFITPGPAGRGKVLKITTNLERAPWIEYRRKLRFGQADPKSPPKIGTDSSYASVAGMEGVHYRSNWMDATAGQRYWLIADMKGKTAGIFFPKIFVKGYLDYADHATALPERSLVERGMTAGQFADLPAAKQKAVIAEDIQKHRDRYRRECFRWYLSCRNEEDAWKHYAAPFPPRGGLPASVKWLKIEVYAYWPPGDFHFDDVLMYKDPRQKAPLPEEKPRSKFFKQGGIQPQPK
ncbi:MAG: hypothetical protein WBF17_02820 [Phycisphaerae bacterium]